MSDSTNLVGEMDGRIWVREWLKTISENPEIPTDEGTMLGWFANAIMSGYDKGRLDLLEKHPNRHPNSARFHELLIEAGVLHDRKQADYGSDEDPFANVSSSIEWGVPAWVGGMIRLNDKVTRLKSMAKKGSLNNESALDSFMDIAVYALIVHVLFEKSLKEERVNGSA